MARILIADLPDAFDLMRRALGAHHELWFGSMLAEAEELLAALDFDLALVSLQFSESQAFDLLNHVRATRGLNQLPVIIHQGRKNRVTDYVIAAAGRCARLMGACDFVNLSECRDELEAVEFTRAVVEKCLAERAYNNGSRGSRLSFPARNKNVD